MIRIFGVILVVMSLLQCSSESSQRTLTVLYTNDEHGWMEGTDEGQGAAEMLARWQSAEGYSADGDFLALSGGDNWTGPAISTWVEGESMVEVMNAMNYDASAVGNHEFDFGMETLAQRVSEADFPYLSANIEFRNTGENLSSIGIFPSVIREVNDIRVGLIGLTTLDTPTATRPKNVEDLVFKSYESSLRKTVSEFSDENVDLLFVISHVCIDSIKELAEAVSDLAINLMGSGHCNELVAETLGSTVILGGGSKFETYAKAVFTYNINSEELEDVTYSTHGNVDSDAEREVAEIVSKWAAMSNDELSVVLGFLETSLGQSDDVFQQAIIDSWLIYEPDADVAITNAGGIRAGLSAGVVSFGSVFDVMPFDNSLVLAEISGEALREVLSAGSRPVIAGVIQDGAGWTFSKTGQGLEDDQLYKVLVNDFMYEGGDNYGRIAEEDPNAINTGIPYRQPFVQWLRDQSSSESNPIKL